MGFNRNILGCKVLFQKSYYLFGNDLIETYWDVKLHSSDENFKSVLDLIETYWDVKYAFLPFFFIAFIDLIETYWDVKS